MKKKILKATHNPSTQLISWHIYFVSALFKVLLGKTESTLICERHMYKDKWHMPTAIRGC